MQRRGSRSFAPSDATTQSFKPALRAQALLHPRLEKRHDVREDSSTSDITLAYHRELLPADCQAGRHGVQLLQADMVRVLRLLVGFEPVSSLSHDGHSSHLDMAQALF